MGDLGERYRQSLSYMLAAQGLTPGGAQTLSKMPARFPLGAYPCALVKGNGATVTDLDGHQYVDWICGLGAVTLGHSDPAVDEAVVRQVLDGGASFSLPHVLEVDVAHRLAALIPCAQQVRFVKTGSEATEAAVRVARIHTGRDLILTMRDGYHSWHSWFQAVKPWHPGVPAEYERLVYGFEYNKIEQVRQLFALFRGRVAAVIMEPCLFEPPGVGYLEEISRLCTDHGALLVFDEMVTGFRWHARGAQHLFGVIPDLATFGKGCANGYPLAFLCGPRELMRHAELISGTFGGDAVALAACLATLRRYEAEPVTQVMTQHGRALIEHVNTVAGVLDVALRADGYGCKPRLRFTYPDYQTVPALGTVGRPCTLNDACMSLLLQELARRGVLLHQSGFNVPYALTNAQLAQTKAALTDAIGVVREAVASPDETWPLLQGGVIRPAVTVRR